MTMEYEATFRIATSATFGLLIGSFLNVVIYRLPRKESIVHPPSACPSCSRQLTARDLVPVLSWVVLRGRCRSCSNKISARYPLIETLTAVLFALVAAKFEAVLPLTAFLALVAGSVALSAIDFDTKTLPTRLVYATGAVGAVLLASSAIRQSDMSPLVRAAISAAVVGAIFFATWWFVPHGFGFGDVRFGTVLAMFLGWLGYGYVFVGMITAFLTGALVGVALLASGRAGRKTALPFGPFLAFGTLFAVLAGTPIVDWWLPAST